MDKEVKMIEEVAVDTTAIKAYTFSDDYAVECYNDDDIYGFLEYLSGEDFFNWKEYTFDSVKDADKFQEGYLSDYEDWMRYSKVILRSDYDTHRKWMLAIDKYNRGELEEPAYDPYEDADFK